MQILLVEDDQTLFQQLKKELENWVSMILVT